MKKIELQEIIEACEAAESEYLRLYRPLQGYEDELEFNIGIDDSLEEVLTEIENKVGIQFPGDLLQLYLISNGGKYFDIDLYPLTADKNDENGLYYKNFVSGIKENYDMPDEMILIGEIEDEVYLGVGIDEEGYYYYCEWDQESRSLDLVYDYLIEMIAHEIDYHTGAFSVDYNEGDEFEDDEDEDSDDEDLDEE